jgi:hydrogenase maturation protein HypF
MRFHETIAAMLADASRIACDMTAVDTVGLSGGCFANRVLLTRLVDLLESHKLRVLYHRQVPCGDGGIALGQALAACWSSVRESES